MILDALATKSESGPADVGAVEKLETAGSAGWKKVDSVEGEDYRAEIGNDDASA